MLNYKRKHISIALLATYSPLVQGSDTALRNTADAAALITWTLPGCGIAYLGAQVILYPV